MRRCHLPLINALAKVWLGAPLDQITLGDLRGRRLTDLARSAAGSALSSAATSTPILRAAGGAITAGLTTDRAPGHVCRVRAASVTAAVARDAKPISGSQSSEALQSTSSSRPSQNQILDLIANSMKFGCVCKGNIPLIPLLFDFAHNALSNMN